MYQEGMKAIIKAMIKMEMSLVYKCSLGRIPATTTPTIRAIITKAVCSLDFEEFLDSIVICNGCIGLWLGLV